MKLRTSFFNVTVLKKDITRFAPVWGLYSVFWLVAAMLLYNDRGAARTAENLFGFMGGACVIQLIYGGLCAAVLFGDLFTPRLSNALHALPLRREGWFLTHLAAGVLFFLVPTGLFSLLMVCLTLPYWQVALSFLGIHFLMFLFFFLTGAFCAACAGNRLGMAALYGIIQFLPLFFMGAVYVFYDPLLYGIELRSEDYLYHSPVFALTGVSFLQFDYHASANTATVIGLAAESWRYLGWMTGVGLVFGALAVILYRSRKLESAGDFISAPWLQPVFLGIYCISVGILLYLLATAFGTEEYVFLLIGLAVGFFTGKMLLQKTVRVFKPKAFLAFGGVLLVLLLSTVAMALDLFGIVSRVPKPGNVESVQLNSPYGWSGTAILEEPADIDAIIAMHQNCLEDRNQSDYVSDTARVELTYRLKNGGEFTRNYNVAVHSVHGETLRKHFSSWQCVFSTDDWEGFKASVSRIYAVKEDDAKIPYAAYDELLEAMRLDCEAGNMVQQHSFHRDSETVYWIEFSLEQDEDADADYQLHSYLNLNIFSDCENTLRVLDRYFPQGE